MQNHCKYCKIIIYLLVIASLCSGCSSLKIAGRFIENPVEKLRYDMLKGSTKSQVDKWQDDIALPGIDIYDNFIEEYKVIQKSGKKDQIEIAKNLQNRANADAKKLHNLRKKLDNIESIKLNDEYLYYTRLMLERMAERLECIEKQAFLKESKEIIRYRDRGWYLERRLVWEARYGSENAASVILQGKSKHRFNNAGAIKKGHSYESVMHILKMPGEWLPDINEKTGNKIVTHRQSVWIDGEQVIYVDFIDGRASKWKFMRIHNGFRNKI